MKEQYILFVIGESFTLSKQFIDLKGNNIVSPSGRSKICIKKDKDKNLYMSSKGSFIITLSNSDLERYKNGEEIKEETNYGLTKYHSTSLHNLLSLFPDLKLNEDSFKVIENIKISPIDLQD